MIQEVNDGKQRTYKLYREAIEMETVQKQQSQEKHNHNHGHDHDHGKMPVVLYFVGLALAVIALFLNEDYQLLQNVLFLLSKLYFPICELLFELLNRGKVLEKTGAETFAEKTAPQDICFDYARHIPVNEIANKYRGGGHAFASGATLLSLDELSLLLNDIKERINE